jgi:hypothetical protein
LGSAFIYTSMQQAVPAPLSKGGGADPLPIPALKAFAVWDKQDGQGGLKNSITKSNTNTGKAFLSMIKRELKAFPVAEGVFRQIATITGWYSPSIYRRPETCALISAEMQTNHGCNLSRLEEEC